MTFACDESDIILGIVNGKCESLREDETIAFPHEPKTCLNLARQRLQSILNGTAKGSDCGSQMSFIKTNKTSGLREFFSIA